ncbi:hypothetical protein IJJ12_02455 [bacterium]|nr:hypothetical protein [bacterium]
MAKLRDIITSQVRVKVLGLFYSKPNELFYIREATRIIDEEINAVRRELLKLSKEGLLYTETRGNRQYFGANKAYAYFPELQQIVFKENGLGKKIRRMRRKLGKLDYVVFTTSFFNSEPKKTDALDILIIGEVVVPELEQLIKEEEKTLGREINFTVLDNQDFKFRKQRRDPFLMDVMYGKRIMIIGDEEEFVAKVNA